MNWRTILSWVLPMIEAAGEAKKAEDENTTGADDAQGIAMVFGVQLFRALIYNKPLPKAPKVLQ